jgi:hypothetical protein
VRGHAVPVQRAAQLEHERDARIGLPLRRAEAA